MLLSTNISAFKCPFGMIMPECSTSTDSYRYAYNGMEMDNEVSGNGNSYTTEFRQYDARLGRWKSLDPLMGMFPHMSPYVAFDNNPVYYTDIYGLSAGEPGDDGANEGGGAGDKGGFSGIMGDSDGAKSMEANTSSYYMNSKGFWSKDAGFGEYIGNVEPDGGQAGYLEISKIKGDFYHENTSNLGAAAANEINSWFGGDDDYWVEKKAYSDAEESFNDGVLLVTELYVSGIVVGKLGTISSKLLKSAGNSIWKINPLRRGFVYEEMLGANLRKIPGYNVIDDFVAATGRATSIKTLDLGAKSYLKSGKPVLSKMKSYIDDLYNFEGVVKGGIDTTNGAIKSKVLEIGIPRGATQAQIIQMNEAVKYAADKGIQLIIRSTK